ncbi:MAG: electron transport complex subunit RsxA [Gammaproteobacteria bacterium]|jgi:electron transport complex protein RnfA
MSDLLLIILATVLVNNFVLVKFLGLCPFMGVSGRVEPATGMALATGFVLTMSSAVSYLAETFVLVPFGLEYLRTLTFILVIACMVQFTELMVQRLSPMLHQVLGIYLPLITTNCAVLGVALLNAGEAASFVESVFYGVGAAGGFALVLILFAEIRERLATAPVPEVFRGAAIGLVTAGIMSLAFMGFSGFGGL